MTILEKIKFEEDWLSEVNLTKQNIRIAFAGIRATALEQQLKVIKFKTNQGEIKTGFLDTSTMIVYFNYLTMDFIQDVLKWEEVKDERKTESKEAEEGT